MQRDPSHIIAVYIMASRRNGTIYVGVTGHLVWRTWQHRTEAMKGFTSDYGCKTLVWYQTFETVIEAIGYEKKIKKWRRAWKLALIEADNPQWLDLAAPWFVDVEPGIATPAMGPFLP